MGTVQLMRLLAAVGFLLAVLPAQAARIVPDAGAPPTDPSGEADLLQFTSGGHALGFTADGMYAAAGNHALHVFFSGVNAVRPQSNPPADTDGPVAPLSRVTYADLWDGITLAYTADAGGIYATAYTLTPGADPAEIRLEYNAPIAVNEDGTLAMAFATGVMTETAPVAWQVIDSRRVAVDAAFWVDGQEVGFAIGSYDPRYVLTIDPVLVWNTFLGGNGGTDEAYSIAVDAGGKIYVAGRGSAAWGNPVRAYTSGDDAFAAKLNSSGGLVWHTFLGGTGSDWGFGIAVDGSGNVYVSGRSDATWGSPVRGFGGGSSDDAFAAKLNSSGGLVWHTFLGGSGTDAGRGIAIDGSGNIYVAGDSGADWGIPVRKYTGNYDAFAAKLNSSGGLVWHAFLGGANEDSGDAVSVDGSGNVYVAGTSLAPWESPVRAYVGGYDAYVAKLNSSGGLVWNTFLGGNGWEYNSGIVLRGDYLFVAGASSQSWGSPVRAFAGGNYDAYVAKLNSSGGLVWNTFLGGSDEDAGQGIAADKGGNIYVVGYSNAAWGSPLRAFAGGRDAFAAKLDYAGGLTAHIFLGGGNTDEGKGIAVDGSGTYVSGRSNATWGAPLRAYGGYWDAFVARVNLPHTCSLEAMELYDLTGDCRTDAVVYRPSTGAWYLRGLASVYYGSTGDKPAPGDYNGDGITDIAVYRPSTGAWYVRNQFSAYYGQSGDIPVPGDYDGDGITDVAVYRPSTGAWFVKGQATKYLGSAGDLPVPGDYNADGTTDRAVYRPSTGGWYILTDFGTSWHPYGTPGDIPVPGDYNGDGAVDIAVYRPSSGGWYSLGSSTVFCGASGDIPIPGDYDGNGTTDIAVYRPSTGAWYVRNQWTVAYGLSGDIPLPELGTGKASTAP